jgi:hypothetical protein
VTWVLSFCENSITSFREAKKAHGVHEKKVEILNTHLLSENRLDWNYGSQAYSLDQWVVVFPFTAWPLILSGGLATRE